MNNNLEKRNDIDLILEFLNQNDLEYKIEDSVTGSFLENIEIKNGVLHLDYNKVLAIDLLHESGHLALLPKKYRYLFSGNLLKGFKAYVGEIEKLTYSDKRVKILTCCDDTEVTAWAWAVGKMLGLKESDIITDESYGGEGQYIRDHLIFSDKATMPYIGVAKLHHAGYTSKLPVAIKLRDPNGVYYPKMNYWTADQALSANGLSLT